MYQWEAAALQARQQQHHYPHAQSARTPPPRARKTRAEMAAAATQDHPRYSSPRAGSNPEILTWPERGRGNVPVPGEESRVTGERARRPPSRPSAAAVDRATRPLWRSPPLPPRSPSGQRRARGCLSFSLQPRSGYKKKKSEMDFTDRGQFL